MKKLLLSLVDGEEHEKLHKLSGISHRHFADRHDYDYDVGEKIGDRPTSWSKIMHMLAAFDLGYERVLFIDNDAVFLRFDIDPMNILNATTAFAMLAEEKPVVNCGVWWIKNEDRAHRFLNDVWAQEDLVKDPVWEQSAVHRLLGYRDGNPRFEYVRNVIICNTFFNDCHGIEDQPVIRHYCGLKNKERYQKMEEDYRNVLGWR